MTTDLHPDECEASGRGYGIFDTEGDEHELPTTVYFGVNAKADAEREMARRQKLSIKDPMWIGKYVAVLRCDVSMVYWNGGGEDPTAAP